MNGHDRKRRLLSSARIAAATLIAAGAGAAFPVPAQSQAQPPSGQGDQSFAIEAGPLDATLAALTRQTGLRVTVDPALIAGRQSRGVQGDHSVYAALHAALAGTGLAYRVSGERSVVIELAPDADGARLLDEVRVGGAGGTAAGVGAGINAVNGSSDATATEGSGSYTSGALTIGSKTPRAIKDTPAAVTVVTRQRIEDQNLTSFSSLLNALPGISVIPGARGGLETEFYSRGFRIQRMQIDGGAPIDIQNTRWGAVPQFDTALYDHAEVLRGADGQFNAYGDPGGVVNLTRKRPLDHFQLVAEAQGGSWNNYRSTFDVTGPIAADGHLRARTVLVFQDQDFFYDVANDNRRIAYGVLEYDLTPATVLGGGVSHTRQRSVPGASGLPRYTTGAALDLPRSVGLAVPWGRYDLDATEVFAWIEHKIDEDWFLKINGTYLDQSRDIVLGTVSGAINPVTRAGARFYQSKEVFGSKQITADMSLSGAFSLFGLKQGVLIGMNHSDADGAGLTQFTVPVFGNQPPVDIFAFDPGDARYAPITTWLPYQTYPEYRRRQTNIYGNLNLTFWQPLHFNIAMRLSEYRTKTQRNVICERAIGCARPDGTVAALGSLVSTHPGGWGNKDVSWPPTVSAVLDVTKSLSAFVTYTDIYLDQSNSVDVNRNPVSPVNGRNIEGGIKWAPRDGRLNVTLSAYHIKQDGFARLDGPLINLGPVSCCYLTDTDLQRISKGADFEVSGELLPGLQVQFGYTYNDNEETGSASYSQGLPLVSRLPKHLYKLWADYRVPGVLRQRLSVGGGVNGQSAGYQSGTACVVAINPVTGLCTGRNAPYEFTQPAFAIVSLRAAFDLNEQVQVGVNINNLFDKTYWQRVSNTAAGNFYGEPRSFAIILRGRL